MGAKSRFLFFCLLISGCAVIKTPPIIKIALLAPFEGRYREVGYDLLYAARLALKDANNPDLSLLPIDDGGTVENALDRARALKADPSIWIVLVAGYAATDSQVQEAYGDLPVIVIGGWDAQPAGSHVFMLASANLRTEFTLSPRIDVLDAAISTTAEIIGGEVLALKQFPHLRDDLSNITIISNAVLPDAAFTERYLASDLYVPAPGLLVILGYDAAQIAAQAVQHGTNRIELSAYLQQITYTGLNGEIRFESGYWANAPLYQYRYDENQHLRAVVGSSG